MRYPKEIDPNFTWLPFYFLPNFSGVKLSFIHGTNIVESRKNREHRRHLLPRALRDHSFEVVTTERESQEFLMFTRFAQGKLVGFPVVVEPLTTPDTILSAIS